MDIRLNAWEVESNEHMLLALTGHASREEYQANRRERAQQVIELCRSAMRSQAESATRFQGSKALPVPGKRGMWYKVRDATARVW
jgi:hypothetical protein